MHGLRVRAELNIAVGGGSGDGVGRAVEIHYLKVLRSLGRSTRMGVGETRARARSLGLRAH